MEAFEQVVKTYMESQGYIVSSNVKFPVRIRTRKKAYPEYQTHGYEVDIVAARQGSLILGSVKSYLGSQGVNQQGFQGIADISKPTEFGAYRIFNDSEVRNGIIDVAMSRYGYSRKSIEVALIVGNFQSTMHQLLIENHLASINDDGVKMKVIALQEMVDSLIKEAQSRTYINDPVIMTIKALGAAGKLSKN